MLGLGTILFGLVVIGCAAFFVFPFFRGAPYVPSQKPTIERILRLVDPKSGQKIADLGSGSGVLVLALARTGAEVHGYEINPVLVIVSRLRIARAGLGRLAHIHWASLWRMKCGSFDTIVVFGIPYMMKQLEQKLEQELCEGAVVVSAVFPMPTWSIDTREGGVYRYVKQSV